MRSGAPDRHLHRLKSGYPEKTNSPQSRKARKEIL
jgi:hypothetical protein